MPPRFPHPSMLGDHIFQVSVQCFTLTSFCIFASPYNTYFFCCLILHWSVSTQVKLWLFIQAGLLPHLLDLRHNGIACSWAALQPPILFFIWCLDSSWTAIRADRFLRRRQYFSDTQKNILSKSFCQPLRKFILKIIQCWLSYPAVINGIITAFGIMEGLC